MKNRYILILILVFSQVLHAQWISSYFGNTPSQIALTNAHGTAVTVDNYGDCYVTGYIDEMLGSGNDILVIKYNAVTGDTIWVRTFNGSDNNDDQGYGIAVDNYQNVYVVGTARNLNKGYDAVLLKYSALGNLIWSKTQYGDALEGEDKGFDIAVDDYGYIYITGYVTCTDMYTDIFTAKYNSWGYRLWYRRDDGTDNLNARGLKIAVDNDGHNVFVTGYIDCNYGSSDIYLINFRSSDGYRMFVTNYNGPGNAEDRAFGIAVDENDNIYITGYVTINTDSGNVDCITLKYDINGQMLWDRTFGGPANEIDRAFGIAVDEDRVFITGSARRTSGNDDYVTVCYSNIGDQIWRKYYEGTGLGSDEAGAIAIIYSSNNDKSIIVTGKSWGENNNNDYATITYSYNTGEQLDSSIYSLNSTTEDVPNDIAVDDQNNAFITGYSQLLGNGPTGSCGVTTIMNRYSERNKKVLSTNIPRQFSLGQNFPNPFNPSTIIRYTISESSPVTLKVYDITGREVTTLMNGYLQAGSYEAMFSSLNLSSGTYFYELVAGRYRDVKKMSLIK